MILNKGDFFTIKRGHMLTPAMALVGPNGETKTIPAQFDRGWDGVVFELLHQQGDEFVAAKVVFPAEKIGYTVHLDISELDVMPLTPQYVAALKTGAQYAEPPLKQNLFNMLFPPPENTDQN